ncbi:unnamed protein product [Brachionus calyciflorus]|uniref:Uncharacterized protein n=1 Tax=Brachionus calyciflorus TaxID=104777 RepID=A0A814H179_9BILA|nr:unnamed protein product [Brachionus calyciflorus]
MEEDSEINIFKRVSELGLVNSFQNCCYLNYLDKQNLKLGGFEILKKKLISSKYDSDVANLKDVEDDNKEDDDDSNDEETDSNTLAKSDSFTQKSIHSDDSTVYDEEDEKVNEISENMNTLTENEVKKVLSKHNNPVACDLCGELISEK